jgi:rRNA maturation endonuclease Nob1
MTCKQICKHSEYEAKKYIRGAQRDSYRKCGGCSIFIKYEGVYCPCCGIRMKHSPVNNKSRKLFREQKMVVNNEI